MFLADPTTIKVWAFWDFKRVPWYTLYDYQYYIPSHQLYVFRERKRKTLYSMKLTQLVEVCRSGQFKPFVLALPQEEARPCA